MNFIDYINRIDGDDVSIHIPNEFMLDHNEFSNVVLLISHELSRTGAPIQLMEFAKALCEIGYNPIVYSLSEGDLVYNYMNINVPVICRSGSSISAEWIDELVSGINLIIINTLVLSSFVRYLVNDTRRVFWWIHESSFMFNKKHYLNIPVSPNLKIIAASEKCRGHITNYMRKEASILNVCIEDCGVSEKNSYDKISFLWAGTLDYNKAPEILLEAVFQLPQSYLEKSNFIIVRHSYINNEYSNLIDNLSLKSKNIYLVDSMDHNEFIDLIDSVDSVVITSIEETMNTVAIEGLMKGKVVICSDGCGNIEYIKNNKTGFVFPVRDSKALSEIFKYIIDNIEKLNDLRKAGRSVYEKNFTFDIFKQHVKSLLS